MCQFRDDVLSFCFWLFSPFVSALCSPLSLSCMFLSVLEHFSSGQRLIKEGECCHVTPLSQMSVGPPRRPEDRPPLLPDNLLLEDSFSTPARAMPPVWTSLPLSHAQLSLAHVLKSGEPQFPPPPPSAALFSLSHLTVLSRLPPRPILPLDAQPSSEDRLPAAHRFGRILAVPLGPARPPSTVAHPPPLRDPRPAWPARPRAREHACLADGLLSAGDGSREVVCNLGRDRSRVCRRGAARRRAERCESPPAGPLGVSLRFYLLLQQPHHSHQFHGESSERGGTHARTSLATN